jgi:hypothetical protein
MVFAMGEGVARETEKSERGYEDRALRERIE